MRKKKTLEAGLQDASNIINQWKQEYSESGYGLCLLHAAALCSELGIVAPEWVGEGLRKGFSDYLNHSARDIGEALDIARPKRYNQSASKFARDNGYKIFMRVKQLHFFERKSIGESLFEEVGNEFCISGSKIRDLYYSAEREYKKIATQIGIKWPDDGFREMFTGNAVDPQDMKKLQNKSNKNVMK